MEVKSEISSKGKYIPKENDVENVELHRAESMVDDSVVIEKIKEGTKEDLNPMHECIAVQVRWVRTKVSVIAAELVMFLYMFSFVLRATTSTVMIMNKVCEVHLGYSEDTCQNIKNFPSVKSEVTKMTNNYHLAHTLLQMAPAAVLALFIGSWSDKYGRRPPLILALSGIIVDGLGSLACAYYFHSRVEYYLITGVFTGFSGGFIGVLMVLYSYASDISTSGKRTMKYAFMQLAFGLAMPLGGLAGGWLFKLSHDGYVHVFTLSVCVHILGLLCVIFLVEETTGLNNTDSVWKKFKKFWTLESVVGSFKATIKKRPNQGRKQIWLLILSMSIAVVSYSSLSGITFIYVHHQFNWDNATYSTVSAVYSVIGLTLMMIIVPLSKKKNFGDPMLGIVGSMALGLKEVCTGLANKVWIFHLANLLGVLNSLGTLAGRSRISKVVPKEDLGKVFAFLTTAECFGPIAATTIVSQAFNSTLDFFPGLIYVVLGVLMIIPVGVHIWIYTLPTVNEAETEEKGKKESDEEMAGDKEQTKF